MDSGRWSVELDNRSAKLEEGGESGDKAKKLDVSRIERHANGEMKTPSVEYRQEGWSSEGARFGLA
jgi:hypothetical protein